MFCLARDVFISYSSKDKSSAFAVCSFLESNGIKCWIAPRDIPPGKKYAKSIMDGIKDSKLLVVIFSLNSNRSVHVSAEIERAMSKGDRIVPFRIEDVLPSGEMEYYLSGWHWLDAITQPLEQHFGKLLATVQNYLSGRLADDDINVVSSSIPERYRYAPPANTVIKKSEARSAIKWIAVVAAVIILATIAFGIMKGINDIRQRMAGNLNASTTETGGNNGLDAIAGLKDENPAESGTTVGDGGSAQMPADDGADDVRVLPGERGNSNGNISNGGIVAQKDGWIYYRDFSRGGLLYKMTADLKKRVKLCDDVCEYINVAGNWVYYMNGSDGNKIYRIKTDGNQRTKINDDESYFLTVVGDWIYYQNASDGCRLYKIRVNGSERTQMNDDRTEYICIDGGWVYYTQGSGYGHGDGDIYRISDDMRTRSRVMECECSFLAVDNGRMYFVQDGSIYTASTSGEGLVNYKGTAGSVLNIHNNWIYFYNDSIKQICKVSVSDTEANAVKTAAKDNLNFYGCYGRFGLSSDLIFTENGQWGL